MLEAWGFSELPARVWAFAGASEAGALVPCASDCPADGNPELLVNVSERGPCGDNRRRSL